MQDYMILVHDGSTYRPVAGIMPNGRPIWAASRVDRLVWYGLNRQKLAQKKARLFKRFPKLRISIRKVG